MCFPIHVILVSVDNFFEPRSKRKTQIAPDAKWEIQFEGYDAKRSRALFFAVITATHTNDMEGFPPATNKGTVSDYAYSLTFNKAGKISNMTKIWNDQFSMVEFGWV